MPDVLHIVLFKWKPGTTQDQRDEIHSVLRSLESRIPGIREIQCGENFSDRAQGFETVLVVRFESRQALEDYLQHPAHREVVQRYIAPSRQESIVADIDVEAARV